LLTSGEISVKYSLLWKNLIPFKKNIILGPGWLRSLVADYGVPLMVLVWTGVSYIPTGDVPKGIPRRLFSPNPWSPGAYENWTVVKVCLYLEIQTHPNKNI